MVGERSGGVEEWWDSGVVGQWSGGVEDGGGGCEAVEWWGRGVVG